MSNNNELAPELLYTRTDPALIPFKTTDEAEVLGDIIGQTRALDAIEFGIQIQKSGFNIYALGPHGIGKHSTISQYLSKESESKQTPPDWCYVNNFEDPRKPIALSLPAGQGQDLCADIGRLIHDARTSMPVAFESDEYRAKQEEIQEKYEDRREDAFKKLTEEASEHGVELIKGRRGFMLGPVVNGKAVNVEEFSKLPKDQQERLSEVVEIYEEKLSALMHRMPQLAREENEEILELDHENALMTVESLVHSLLDKYKDFPKISEYIDNVKTDIAEHVSEFTGQPETMSRLGLGESSESFFRRYEANLFVDNRKTSGAPIIYEDNPVYQKLMGMIEHESRLGALFTDFTHVKPGALHRANGGYLVLDADKVLQEPFAWDALKRALFAKQISIQSIGSLYGLVDTVSLEAEPIPLEIKVVLLGNRMLYYLLLQYDPDFRELFKVAADFEEEMDRSEDNIQLYANMIATLAKKEKLLAFDASAVSRIIEHGARLADDSEKLSTHMLSIADIMQESEHFAKKAEAACVSSSHVQQAINAQIYRADRLREKYHEEIQRDTILIDTESDKTASVNGLAVIDLSNYRFAHPVRITATTRMGSGKVIDISRESELGGNIHSKGVMILSSYLASRYTRQQPLSFNASLTFEQTYGMIEGDSASAAELCALLSALADTPIQQSMAITGSVNQLGQVQAIGGVNEKIEGFFDICNTRGLNGKHGVIIPRSNVPHLMLRHDVVDAVSDGQFHVYSVATVDEAIELLTGMTAGEPDENGEFPEGSINYRVAYKLLELSKARSEFNKSNSN